MLKKVKKINFAKYIFQFFRGSYITMLAPAMVISENQDINQFISDYENLKTKVVFNFDTKKQIKPTYLGLIYRASAQNSLTFLQFLDKIWSYDRNCY